MQIRLATAEPGVSWQLYRSTDMRDWFLVGQFSDLIDATRRIVEFEGLSDSALSLQTRIEHDPYSGEEQIGQLEYHGKFGTYIISREDRPAIRN